MASPSDIKAYLREHRRSSLADLALHFDVSPDGARALIEPWLGKEKVRRLADPKGGCGCGKSCCSAGVSAEIYEWIGA